MDWYLVVMGLGGLLVGAIGGVVGILAFVFEKQKWKKSNQADAAVTLSFFPEFSHLFQLTAVNVGMPELTLRWVGFDIGPKGGDAFVLFPLDHPLLELPKKLERWDEHTVDVPVGLLARILRDTLDINDASVFLTGFFIDNTGGIHQAKQVEKLDIAWWYQNPPTKEEVEAGDRCTSGSLTGIRSSVIDDLKRK